MVTINAGDHMAASAKAAVDTAMLEVQARVMRPASTEAAPVPAVPEVALAAPADPIPAPVLPRG